MTTTIAIIGRPNVGKSTLFNHLTRTRNALVADQPGVTRDRHYGYCEYDDRTFLLIDTGGLFDINESNHAIARIISEQSFHAIEEADAVFWVVDGREGPSSLDEDIAQKLRPLNKRIYLLVNKSEGLDSHTITSEFYPLGMSEPVPVSAKRGSGVSSLMETVIKDFPAATGELPEAAEGLRISLIGRPNVGKSTLTNRLVGEERMLTFEHPGTTRDSISVPFERRGKKYILIDTAGVRRRSRIKDTVEKFSILKTIEALEKAQVVILVVDAQEGLTEQDLTLLGMTAESGKSLIIAVNKWDGQDEDRKKSIQNQLDRKLGFVEYACIHYISALHGTGTGKLFQSIDKISQAQNIDINASRITEILDEATMAHQPPMIKGRRIKLRYAHIGGHNPVRIIVHGNQTDKVPVSYQRYLSNTFRKQLKLTGTPVLIEFRKGENPYKGRKNILTKSQVAKRRRMMKYTKNRK